MKIITQNKITYIVFKFVIYIFLYLGYHFPDLGCNFSDWKCFFFILWYIIMHFFRMSIYIQYNIAQH